MIKSRVVPKILLRKQFIRYASKQNKGPALQIPFLDDLSSANSDMLEYFPNLEGFYDMNQQQPTQTAELSQESEYDFSEIPMLSGVENKLGQKNLEFGKSYPTASDVDLSLGDITKSYTTDELEELKEMTNLSTLIRPLETDNNLLLDKSPLDLSSFFNRIHGNDTKPQNRVVDLETISTNEEPMTILSKFNDPYINLALEYYLYDRMPVSNDISRLVIYKNKPCIVIGKNQNPLKEINMHYSNITSTPILRRLSGGGTVVHDLGNVNFSFMTKKSHFDRTNFTDIMVGNLNLLVTSTENLTVNGKQVMKPVSTLGTIAKGDIVNVSNDKKISGSAFKLSKGKFIHHGTMLLNAHLPNLKSLLSITPDRKQSIVANGTDSIPSSVENYQIDETLFLYSLINSYNKNYKSSNLYIIDNYSSLPLEVFKRAKELSYWSWVFGKTPFFKHVLKHPHYDFKVVLEVEKYCIKDLTLESESHDIEAKFENLISAIKEEGRSIRYIGKEVGSLVDDAEISKWLSWEIDFNSNYENFGVDLNR